MQLILRTSFWVAACASFALNANAAIITGYDIPQTVGAYTSINPIAGGAPEVSATALTRTANLSGAAFDNHFYYSNWGTAFDPAKFYATTLTVASGKSLTLSDVSYSVEDTGAGGGIFSTFQVRSSLDGFSSIIDSFALSNFSGDVVNRTSSLAGLGSISGSIEFRFYATTGASFVTMGFANHLPGGAGGGLSDVGQNIRFNGTISDVPAPASLILWGMGGGLTFLGKKLRRGRKTELAA